MWHPLMLLAGWLAEGPVVVVIGRSAYRPQGPALGEGSAKA